jgi:hypothetical protein
VLHDFSCVQLVSQEKNKPAFHHQTPGKVQSEESRG